jgi:hypothetical protein
MSSYAKRIEALEKAAGLGRYADDFCRCPGPILIKVDWSAISGKEPESVEPEFCNECGREKEYVTLAVVYDDVPNSQQHEQDFISRDNLN